MSSNNNNQSFQNLSQLNSSQDAGQKSYFQYSLIRLKENGQLARTYNQEIVQKQIGMNKYKMGDYMQMFTNTKEQYKELNENEDLQQSFKGRYSFSSQKQPPQNSDSAKKVSPSPTKRQTTRDATYPCYFEQIDGVYEGDVDLNYKKEGLGMFIADSGEAYIGEWTNDQMHGEGILHFPFGGYIYGQFKQGRVQGVGILQLPQNQIYIGYWKQSRLNGKCFELNLAKKTWLMSEYANGQLVNRLASEPAEITQSSGLAGPKFMEPYEDIRFWMQRLSKKLYFAEREINVNQKHLRYMNIEKGLDYIGFLENKKTPNGLGLVSFEKRIISGNFKSGVLDGSGRMILENGDIYDGYFKGGRFQGVGVYFNFERNTYLHAIFDENKPQSVIAKGVGYPSNIIVKLKSENHRFHKRYYQKESHFERISVLQDFSRQVYLDYQEMYSSNQQDQQERYNFPETYEPHNPDPLLQLQAQQQQSSNMGGSSNQQQQQQPQQQQQNSLQSPSSPEKSSLLQTGSIKNTKTKSHFLEKLTDSPFSLTLQEMLANKQKLDSTSAEAPNTSSPHLSGPLVKQNSNNNIFEAKTSVIVNNNSQNNQSNTNNTQNNQQTQPSQLVPPNSSSSQPQGQTTQQTSQPGFPLQRSQTQDSNSSRPGTANLNPTIIPNNQNNNNVQNTNNNLNNTNIINATFQNNSNNKSNNNSSNNSGNSSLINPSNLNQQMKQRENLSAQQQQLFSSTLQQKLAQQQQPQYQNYPENIIDSPVKQDFQEIRTNMGIQGRRPFNSGIGGAPSFAMNRIPGNNNNNPGINMVPQLDQYSNYQQSLQYPYQNNQYSPQDYARSYTPNERMNYTNQFPFPNNSSFFTPQQSQLFQQRLQEMKPYPRRQRIFQDSPPKSNKGSPQRSFKPDKNSIEKSLKNNFQIDLEQGQGQINDGTDNLSHSQRSQGSSQRLARNDTARSTLSQQRVRKSALLSEINPSNEKQNLTLQSGILVTPEDPKIQSKSQDNAQWFFNPQNQQLTLQPQYNSKLNFSDLTQARQDHFGANNQYRAELSAGARVKLRSIITEESKQSLEWKKDKNKKSNYEEIVQTSQYNKQGQRIDSVKNFSFSPDSKQRESMLLLCENDRTNSELTLRISVAGSEKLSAAPAKRAIFHPIPLQNFEEDRSESKFFRNEYRLQQQKELQLQVKRSKRSRKNILEPLVTQSKGFELLGSEFRDVVNDNRQTEKKQPTGRMSSQLKDSLLNLQTYDAALNFKETAMNQQQSNYSPSSSYILTNRGNNASQFMQSTGFDRQIGQQSQSMSPQGSEMTSDYQNNKQFSQAQAQRVGATNFRQGKQSFSQQQNQQNIPETDDNSSKLKGIRQSQQQGFSSGNPQGMFVSFDNKNAK